MNSVFGTVPKLWRGRAFPTGAEVMAPGQVSVLHPAKGAGGYTALFSLSSHLIISVKETGKELKVKTELVILYQQLHTVHWGPFTEKYKQLLGLVQSACFSVIISASCHQAGELWDCWDLAALFLFAERRRMHFSISVMSLSSSVAELEGSGDL